MDATARRTLPDKNHGIASEDQLRDAAKELIGKGAEKDPAALATLGGKHFKLSHDGVVPIASMIKAADMGTGSEDDDEEPDYEGSGFDY